ARFVTQRKFRTDSRHGSIGVYAIARFKFLNAAADGLDNSRSIGAWCVRQIRFTRVRSRSDVCIDWIDPGSLDADEYVSGIRPGIRYVDEHQHFWSTKLADSNRFHHLLLLQLSFAKRKQLIISKV